MVTSNDQIDQAREYPKIADSREFLDISSETLDSVSNIHKRGEISFLNFNNEKSDTKEIGMFEITKSPFFKQYKNEDDRSEISSKTIKVYAGVGSDIKDTFDKTKKYISESKIFKKIQPRKPGLSLNIKKLDSLGTQTSIKSYMKTLTGKELNTKYLNLEPVPLQPISANSPEKKTPVISQYFKHKNGDEIREFKI